MQNIYPLSFKAAIIEKKNKPLAIKTISFNGPLRIGQVLVKLRFTGICGKQIEEISGLDGNDPYIPHLLGHEGSGFVVDIGKGVKKVKKGDKVVLHWMKGSGLESRTPLYYNKKNVKINAGWVTTFNEYAVVSENRVTPIAKESSWEVATLMGCCVTTGLGAVINLANAKSSDIGIVIGCGGVGLSIIQGLKYRKVKRIIAVDIRNNNLRKARFLGATEVINSLKTNLEKRILKMLENNNKTTKVFVSTNNQRALEKAFMLTSAKGQCFVVGRPPRKETIKISALDIFLGKKIMGCHGGDCLPDKDIPLYIKYEKENKIKIKKLIYKTYQFKDINKAILDFKKNAVGRCLIEF